MKKYLYTLLFMAVALFSAATLVSCGDNNDDDFPGGGDKPAVTKIYVCTADISQAILDLYDIQLTLHSGASSKVVKIDKANGQALNGKFGKNENEFKAYRFIYDNVDGNKSIDYIEAKVTPKAEAENLLKAMNPEDVLILLAASRLVNVEFQPNGNYSFEGLGTTNAIDMAPETLLNPHPNTGVERYKGLAELFQRNLSKKRPDM